MTPSDVESLFRDRLNIRLGDGMSDYLIRRFLEGGAACAPVVPAAPSDEVPGAPVQRYDEVADAFADGPVPAADPVDPLLQ